MRSGRNRQTLTWTPYDWVCMIGVDFGEFQVGKGESAHHKMVCG